MTSIEWLWEQIDGIIPYQDIKTSQLFNGVLEQAKLLHKEEMKKCYEHGSFALLDTGHGDTFEQYYQETFVSKGSDFKQFSLYEHKETITSADTQVSKTFLEAQPQLPQQEISDEEIEKGAEDWYNKEGIIKIIKPNKVEIRAWISACKWYREQLKLKL